MNKATWFALGCLALAAIPAMTACPSADMTGDCRVDFADLALLAGQWMDEGSFTLQVNSSGALGVNIASSTGHGGTTDYTLTLTAGTGVTLTAPVVAAGDEVFTGWTGDASGADQTIALTMNPDRTVTAEYAPVLTDMVWVFVDDPGVAGHEGFRGRMSKYLTTNGQYCAFLNAALASGDITIAGGTVKGANGSNEGEDFALAVYYSTTGSGITVYGATNGGAARIHYSDGVFSVDNGFENHPVTYVSWCGAAAFCSYYGYRLATEWEWAAAADYDGSFVYGYGRTKDGSKVNCNGSPHPNGTTVVGTFGAYGYGLADVTGNVWEFTSTLDGAKRMLRGGGWLNTDALCQVTSRLSVAPDGTHYDYGFRAVQDVYPEDLAQIPAGTFQMGDSLSDSYDGAGELPVHTVSVDSFYMGKYEITNGQYCEFLNSAWQQGLVRVNDGEIYASDDAGGERHYCHLSSTYYPNQITFDWIKFSVKTKGGRDMSQDPVVQVTWYGAAAYCNWRSQHERREPCYDLSTWECDFSKKGYRLATEAEWEYAARGGLAGARFPWGDTITHNEANYYSSGIADYDNSPLNDSHPDWDDGIQPYTAPVGRFLPNGYGLYDMAGNVWEWCHDWFSLTYYEVSPQTNPTGPSSGGNRLLRGGSWRIDAPCHRVASRYSYAPNHHDSDFGFRVVLGL